MPWRFVLAAVMFLISFVPSGKSDVQLAQVGIPVDLELVLAVDNSGSVDTREYELQMEGLIRAFQDPAIIAAIIGTSAAGGVAVTVVHWSSVNEQAQRVPWTVVRDEASAIAFSAMISSAKSRTFGDSTGIGGLLQYAERLIRRNAYTGRRKSIDVSGDGSNNSGIPPDLVRNMVVEEGITVNGLTILNDEPYLHHYYVKNVIGGSGAFVMTVNNYSDIIVGTRNKLLREISVNVASGPQEVLVAARPVPPPYME